METALGGADFRQRIEELSLSAWPALEQLVHDGWVLRASNGYTRRSNSVTALHPGDDDLAERLCVCERFYAERHLPPVFRVTSLAAAAGLDDALAGLGYAKRDKTSVRFMDLRSFPPTMPDGTELAASASEEWLAGLARVSASTSSQRKAHRAILDAIVAPTLFACARHQGEMVSFAFGVLEDRQVCINSVATDPAWRRRGFSKRTVRAVLAWAKGRGADGAYLQVAKSNRPALQLYSSIGFRTELYRYHYRSKPAS